MKVDKNSILQAPSDERIEWFENVYRVQLPTEYKQFLREFNGGRPITNVLKHNGEEYVVERFLCLLDQPKENAIFGEYDLTTVLTELDCRLIDDEDLIGMNVIPIAALFSGDFICLDYRKSVNPTVTVWDHEESDEFEPVMEEVADSVAKFFEMLSE